MLCKRQVRALHERVDPDIRRSTGPRRRVRAMSPLTGSMLGRFLGPPGMRMVHTGPGREAPFPLTGMRMVRTGPGREAPSPSPAPC